MASCWHQRLWCPQVRPEGCAVMSLSNLRTCKLTASASCSITVEPHCDFECSIYVDRIGSNMSALLVNEGSHTENRDDGQYVNTSDWLQLRVCWKQRQRHTLCRNHKSQLSLWRLLTLLQTFMAAVYGMGDHHIHA